MKSYAFGLRYSDDVSVNGDATFDMEIGREANMIGYGIDNKTMNSRARPGRFALVVPTKNVLISTRKGYIHLVQSSDGIDVWKSDKQYKAKKALFMGEISLTDSEIDDICKCGIAISDDVATKVVERFWSLR